MPRQPSRLSVIASGSLNPWLLFALAVVSGCAYLAIAKLSGRFVVGQGFTDRPILEVLGWFALAFGCYLAALWLAIRGTAGRRLLVLIVVPAVIFRATLLTSTPIQEVDIYRYLWDGAVSCVGVSPFRYSPQQVLDAQRGDQKPDELARLLELRDSSSEMREILQKVHFGHLPTVYPPVSQVVFALATLTTSSDASVSARISVMKAWFLAFDLATLALVIGLLHYARRHVGWSLAYAWCPLLMKEVANGGHLDAVAVFLTTLALWVAARGFFGGEGASRRGDAFKHGLIAAGVLALAVGAKLYPVVLAPLLIATCFRRAGAAAAGTAGVVFLFTSLVVLSPMAPGSFSDESDRQEVAGSDGAGIRPPEISETSKPQDPTRGLTAFLRSWEINDFLFLIVVENVRPESETPPGERPWFSVLPNSWRVAIVEQMRRFSIRDPNAAAFVFTRGLTSLIFLAIALVLAHRAGRSTEPEIWLQAAFLTLAWFWLLSPTQNPWYWTWVLPLVPFARGRAWLALSGLALMYYLRFWLGYHRADELFAGTIYTGTLFFDFVVTWIEFAPWFLWLAIESWLHRRRTG